MLGTLDGSGRSRTSYDGPDVTVTVTEIKRKINSHQERHSLNLLLKLASKMGLINFNSGVFDEIHLFEVYFCNVL